MKEKTVEEVKRKEGRVKESGNEKVEEEDE